MLKGKFADKGDNPMYNLNIYNVEGQWVVIRSTIPDNGSALKIRF